MDSLRNIILELRTVNYNMQCEYVKNKLLPNKSHDITRTVFFKKLYVILCKWPKKLKEICIKIGDNNSSFFNFWSDFEDKLYFLDVRGFIELDFV